MKIDVDNSMVEKDKTKRKVVKIVIYALLIFLVFVYILPLLWILMSST